MSRAAVPTEAADGCARQRLRSFFLKPPDPSRQAAAPRTRPVEELEDAARFADDKERAVGLLAAPFGAAIALLVYGALAANDPPALVDGVANAKHVALPLYGDLLGVLLVLAVAMLVTAWFRKRLFLGCAMALYGLAVFNMHYWGFGVPYVLFGAWLLVRAYRANRDLREATTSTATGRRGNALAPAPAKSKRYTPPSARTTRAG